MKSDTKGNLIKSNGAILLISLIALASISFRVGQYSKSFLVGKNAVLDQHLFNAYLKEKDNTGDNVASMDNMNDEEEDDEEEEEDDDGENDEDNNKIFPASGVHLNVEFHHIKDISQLLNKEKMSNSLVNAIKKTPMKILSYHCTSSNKDDHVTCFVILNNKSHVFIHTYIDPNTKGTIAIDILACDEAQLLLVNDVLPMLHDEFTSYYSSSAVDKTKNTRWKAFLRNSPKETGKVRHFCYEDLCFEYLSLKNVLKTEIISVESPYQTISVWDVLNPRYINLESHFKSLSSDSSYESLHPEYYQPQRVIFLDSVSQSSSQGVEAYHEALVQPAMFAHSNPKRVAIIGGGEGATLREALKHKTVDNVTMIDIDEIMCKVSAKVLYPLWNSCDDFTNQSSCFDEPRAHVQYEDALSWFIQRFSDDNNNDENNKFDVVIMDALDPQDTVEFANILYQDLTFWKSVYNAITDDGVLVAQLGNAPYIDDSDDMSNGNVRRAAIIEVLQSVGFQTTHSYEEGHAGFHDPWTFLIICKSHKCDHNWYANPAQVELAIQKRILPTKSKQPLLKHFDGATMAQYRVPHKGLEVVYCRKVPTPIECEMIPYNSNDHYGHRQQQLSPSSKTKQVYFHNHQGDVSVVYNMGTSIPISVQSLLSAYQNDYMEKLGHHDESKRADQLLLPIISKLIGPSSIEHLKSCPLTLLTDDDIDTVCSSSSSSNDFSNLQVERNNSASNSNTATANTLFYSPLLDRHIPLFGHLGNYKRE